MYECKYTNISNTATLAPNFSNAAKIDNKINRLRNKGGCRKMVSKKFSLIAAACENMGIGINGQLPWRLKNELAYFNAMTCKTSDPSKRNACIMGRHTYFGIPPSHRPLPGRLNIVLSRASSAADYPADVLLCASLSEAMSLLQKCYANEVENVWIAGGNTVYKEAMESDLCHRIYMTDIKALFDCDTFFPAINPDAFRLVENDGGVPVVEQEEKGIRYQYKIYEKIA